MHAHQHTHAQRKKKSCHACRQVKSHIYKYMSSHIYKDCQRKQGSLQVVHESFESCTCHGLNAWRATNSQEEAKHFTRSLSCAPHCTNSQTRSEAQFRPYMSHLHFSNSMNGAPHCTNSQKRSRAHFRPSMSHLHCSNSVSGAPHRTNSQNKK